MRKRRANITQEIKDKIKELYDLGWSYRKIGRELDMDYSGVPYHVGVKRKKRRKAKFVMKKEKVVQPVLLKKSPKYLELLNEPINPGKDYKGYLNDKGIKLKYSTFGYLKRKK